MHHFWHIARMILGYPRELAIAALGAGIDMIFAAARIGVLLWLATQLLNRNVTARDIVGNTLSSQRVIGLFGDQTWLIQHVPADAFAGFVFLIAVILGCAILGAIGYFIHQHQAYTITATLIKDLRQRMFRRAIAAPLTTTESQGVGEKLVRFIEDTEIVRKGLSLLLGWNVRKILQGLVCIAWAAVLSLKLTLMFGAVVPILAYSIRWFARRTRRALLVRLKRTAKLVDVIHEALQSLPTVKVHHAEGYERRRFTRANKHLMAAYHRLNVIRAQSLPIIEAIGMTGILIAMAFAGYDALELGNETPDNTLKVIALLIGAAVILQPLSDMTTILQRSAASATRIIESMAIPVEPRPTEESDRKLQRLPRHHDSIAFDDVWFTYPGSEEPTLCGVTFTVPAGKVCAIVGSNGSGKTTLLNLLPRLRDLDKGRILIDGVDTSTCTLRSVRAQIGMVTQDTVLFDGTIADNIRYGAAHASKEDLLAASRRAQVHEFVDRTALVRRVQRCLHTVRCDDVQQIHPCSSVILARGPRIARPRRPAESRPVGTEGW